MKLFIASDIHGSALYCEKMIRAYEYSGADKLILLGDILYHGPRNDLPEEYAPKKAAKMLNEISDRILCVCGNCDAEVDGMVLDFPVLCESALIFVDGVEMFLTHGHKQNMQNPPKVSEGTVVLSGHTHIPLDEVKDGIRYINPGSVSIPKEGSSHSYVIFEDGEFTFHSLD